MYACISVLYTTVYRKEWTEAEFLDVVGIKVLRVFLLAIHSHLYSQISLPPPPLEQKWFETGL
jgi:hypothetical protein